jgi:hypothetical protein
MISFTFGPAGLVYEIDCPRVGFGDLEANMAKYAHELRGLKLVEFKVYQRGHGETKTPSQHVFYFNITDNAAKTLHQMWFLEALEGKAQSDPARRWTNGELVRSAAQRQDHRRGEGEDHRPKSLEDVQNDGR